MFPKNILNYNNTNTAVILPNGDKFSYGDLQSYSKKIYQKINNRCLVFCLSKNHIGSLCGYISFLSNKVVCLLLDSSMSPELIEPLINKYKPKYLWLPNERVELSKFGKPVFRLLEHTLLKTDFDNKIKLNENLALLLTTSGSLGSPKLVRLSYQNVLSNAISIADYLSIDKNERPITLLPIHYSFGLSIINSHLIKGATILLNDLSLMNKGFWEFLKNYQSTSLSGVPYSFEILKKLRFFKLYLPYLKTITQAGGKLNDELISDFAYFCQKNDKRFFVMYGQTEASPRISYLPYEYSTSKLGSIGIAIPGGKLSLINDQGKVIKRNETIGELVYEGPNVSMGYAFDCYDLAKNDENNGVLHTGDIARRDKDSFYYIVGRKKRFIKLYGNRVNLDETERLLKNMIPDVACAGKDDNMIIYITEKKYLNEISSFISEKIGINSNAFIVKLIENIPKNTSGKTIYSELPN